MNETQALIAFEALSNRDRLAAFRLLAARSPQGLPSGEIAAELGIPPTTMSFHLSTLERSGLCRNWREGRKVFYGVSPADVAGLVVFLTEDCCAGRPELCAGTSRECKT